MTELLRRILRTYRNMGPTEFDITNQRIRLALTDNEKIPTSTWGSNPDLLPRYFAASDKHHAVHQEAAYRSTLAIRERDLLEKQIISYLDEIALDLEAEAVRNPEILLFCGFDLAKERRSSPRAKSARSTADGSGASEHGNG